MSDSDDVSQPVPDPPSLEDVRAIRSAAKAGDVQAQYRLGTYFRRGRHGARNYGEAVRWYRKAAEQADARAQRALGDLYRDGHGVPEDWAEAAMWYRKAAEQGDAGAQAYVGLFYHYGQGVTQDYVEAAKWHRKAADQGNACAQRILGDLYRDGKGVAQDYVEAATWYRKAAAQGDAYAQVALGLFCKLGLGAQCDYAEAASWYRKAAEQGDAQAQINLGLLHHHGLGVPQDYAEAAMWYWRAADQGDAGAQRALGSLYREGKGVPQDYVEAATWFRKAAEQGDAHARLFLGHLYGKGQGVAQDYLEAARWYRKAADGLGPLATEALESLEAGAPPLALAELGLDGLPGMAQVKATVRQLAEHVKVEQIRRERGLKVTPVSRHCVFSGPPSAGKTTVARLLGRMLTRMGVLSTDSLVEVDRADLVAKDEGQTTTQKVRQAVERAQGGVLFIRDADSLAPPGQVDTNGWEAIDALVERIEDRPEDLVVVVAGSADRMQALLDSNPGLRSRFKWYFQFQDYEPGESVELFLRFANADGLKVAPACLDGVKLICEDARADRGPEFGSERFVRQLYEDTLLKQSARLASLHDMSDEALQTLLPEDLDARGR